MCPYIGFNIGLPVGGVFRLQLRVIYACSVQTVCTYRELLVVTYKLHCSPYVGVPYEIRRTRMYRIIMLIIRTVL